FIQAEDGIRDRNVTGVQTCALPILEEVKDQIMDLLGCDEDEILLASGKTGVGVPKILETIINKIPAPKGDVDEPLQALIFVSMFNSFMGVLAYFRIFNVTLRKEDKVKFVNTGQEYRADEIGILGLKQDPRDVVKAGNVSYIITGIKDAKEVKVGDTITLKKNPCLNVVQGFEEVKPMVFAGIFPISNDDFEELRDCMDKLQLND